MKDKTGEKGLDMSMINPRCLAIASFMKIVDDEDSKILGTPSISNWNKDKNLLQSTINRSGSTFKNLSSNEKEVLIRPEVLVVWNECAQQVGVCIPPVLCCFEQYINCKFLAINIIYCMGPLF